MKLLLATHNIHKVKEIRHKFSLIKHIKIISADEFGTIPEIVEDGSTFEANAIKKAKEISRITDLAVMSDDSGLVVDALQGRPGIFSARYGGLSSDREKNLKILDEMKNIQNRNARFVCVIAFAFPDGTIETTEGVCEGIISENPSGENGFGYDPIFFLPDRGKTMAEISIDEKNTISHRAKALENAVHILNKKNSPA